MHVFLWGEIKGGDKTAVAGKNPFYSVVAVVGTFAQRTIVIEDVNGSCCDVQI